MRASTALSVSACLLLFGLAAAMIAGIPTGPATSSTKSPTATGCGSCSPSCPCGCGSGSPCRCGGVPAE